MSSSTICRAIASVSLALLFSLTAFAQGERTTVTGTVVDTSGAIIPGATVVVRQVSTNITVRAESNSAGIFYVPSLGIGKYEITVEKQGFRPYRVADINLTVGLTATVNAVMEVGSVSEAVEVKASAVQLEAQTSGLGKVVETRRIVELPLLGRNPLSLVSTAAGVIPTGGNTTGSSTDAQISGGLRQQNGLLIDGGESRGTNENGAAYSVPLESVAEFKVETATYSAEFGRAAGGVVNLATKSGTNSFHGVLYEYLRNDHLNANSWSNNRNRVAKGLFQRNEFGGSIGGRIIRDRTFFFANYEGTRQGSPDQFLATVPTTLQKQGDFSQTFDRNNRPVMIYDYTTTRPDPNNPGKFVRDQFPGNVIPQSRIHPISQKVLGLWANPNRAGETPAQVNNFFLAGKSVTNTNDWFSRVDHAISDKHRLYGRAGGRLHNSYSTLELNEAFPSRSRSSNPTISSLISLTSAFSPTILGEGRISYTRLQFNTYPLSDGYDIGALGFDKSVVNAITYKVFPQISVQTYAQGAGLAVTGAAPNEFTQLGGTGRTVNPMDTYHAQYHATFIKTRHKIRAGGDYEILRLMPFNSQQSAGQYIFDRVYTQGPDPTAATLFGGNGFASFLLGVPQAGAMTISRPLFLWQHYYAGYVQDDWRVTNTFTLNLGLRWEYTTPYAEKYGQIGYIDFDAIDPVAGVPGTFKPIEPGGYQNDPQRKQFSPRLGFAWQVNPKTVMRAAGAIFYATYIGVNPASSDFGNGSFLSNALYLGPPNPLPNTPPVGSSWTNAFAGGIINPDRTTSFAGQNVRGDVRNHPYAYMGNWTYSLQREVTPNLMVEAAYVGSKTTHLYWNRQHNQNSPDLMSLGSTLRDPVPNPFFGKILTGALSAPTIERRQLLRPYPQFLDLLIFRDPYADMSYQSMTLRVEKQYSRGLTMSVGYTLSKTIASTAQSNGWVVGPSNSLYDARYNKAPEANDVPQRLVFSYVYDLPFGKGRPWMNQGIVAGILGGWEVSGITVLQKGGRL